MYSWPDNAARTPLPIDDKLNEILTLLKQNRVVICEAETGAGKTTRIGQAAILADPTLHVIMTQTRRNACRWNGQRIASELQCKPGQLVGWRLANETPVISPSTRLELMIDQSLVQKIRREKTLPKGLLIIDEAHERSLSIDLLLGLIKEKLPSSPETHILIVSATLDTQKFSAFFNYAPIIHIKGRCYPVSTEIITLQHSEHHTDGAIRAGEELMSRFVRNEISKGTVLILLPGKEDIHEARRRLHATAQKMQVSHRIELLSCHGESSTEEQNLVQKPVPANILRFVCGTEVLRNSVTIPETIGVIDSLQIKRLITHANGIGELTKIPVSKAEADQAKGRAGRTNPGFYMPISFNDEYDRLEEWPKAAILREPLSHVILHIAATTRFIRNFAFIDAPDLEKLDLTINKLKTLGALADDESITEMGEKLVNIPLSPELAKVLLTANDLDVLPEAIIVAAALDAESIFQLPMLDVINVDENFLEQILSFAQINMNALPAWITKKQNQLWEINFKHADFPNPKGFKWFLNQLRKNWAGDSQSDFVAIVSAYREFCAKRQSSKKPKEKDLIEWCNIRGLHYKRICQAEDKMKQICEALQLSSSFNVRATQLGNIRAYNPVALTKALISAKIDDIAFQHNSFTEEFAGKIGIFNLAFESICPKKSKIILINGINKIPIKVGGQTKHRLLATHAAPLDITWLQEMLPHRCTKERQGDYQYNASQCQFVETETIHFDSHVLFSQSTPPDLQHLAKHLADHSEGPDRYYLHNYDLAKILENNRKRQKQARELNETLKQPVFTVFSKDELIHFFKSKLMISAPLGMFLLPPLEIKARLAGIDWRQAHQNKMLKSLNLSGVSLDDTMFVDESSTYKFVSTSEDIRYLPYFLSNSEVNNKQEADRAFTRLLKSKLTPSQLEYVKWSLVMQFIDKNDIADLKWLKNHALLTHPDHKIKFNTGESFFSLVISFFSSGSCEQHMQEKIQQTIEVIEKRPSRAFMPDTYS